MNKFLLAIALALASTPAFAQEPAPVRMEQNPLQYVQSCMPGPMYSMQFGAANRAKVLSSAYLNGGGNIRLNWGTQWKVTCDANGAVLACLHQTVNATISLGVGNDGGDGAGWTAVDSLSGVGAARCIQLTALTPTDFIKVSPASFKCNVAATSRDPTTRCGQCTTAGTGHTVGDPCYSSAYSTAECGSGGVCDATARPKGVYLSLVPVSASSVCYISRCDQ